MNSLLLALSTGVIAGICVGSVAFVFLVLFFCLVPLKSYFIALFSGAYVSMFKLMSLRFRKVNSLLLVNSYILSKKAKLGIKFNELEAHQLAGGNVHETVSALIKAKDAGIDLTFKEASAIDLTTGDIGSAIASVITPKVIELQSIKGITRDNYELEIKANISVRARIQALVGGLGEDTLGSKVSKYILTKITTVNNHKNANAYNLTDGILKSGLDLQNGYELVAVDIVSINVVRDVGAEFAARDLERIKIQAQIEADRQKNYASVQAEQMKVKTEEMKTAVLEAEAEVPKAIAEAIRDGRFSVMDYYKLMNLQADTAMRRALLGKDEEPRG